MSLAPVADVPLSIKSKIIIILYFSYIAIAAKRGTASTAVPVCLDLSFISQNLTNSICRYASETMTFSPAR